MTRVEVIAIEGLPEIARDDDLAAVLAAGAQAAGGFAAGDVLVVAHKIVSKAEGAVVDLQTVRPTARARFLADEHGKDPRAVQVVLDESAAILRAERGVLISRTRHGFVCANAGVDASNAGAEDRVVTLPSDPDASARAALRAALPRVARRRDRRFVRARMASRAVRRRDRHRRSRAARRLARPRRRRRP